MNFRQFKNGRGRKSYGIGRRILGPKKNKMPSYGLYSTNHIKI